MMIITLFFLFCGFSVFADMPQNAKIYVAGHAGLVGTALCTQLCTIGYDNIIGRRSSELDLRDQQAVDAFFAKEKPEYVFLLAAKVGGIKANNTYPADFIYDNLLIEANVIHCAWKHGVKKLLFLGSSCIYPRECSQPIKEDYLLSGYLEKTNEPYAVAKIAGIKLCQSYNRQHGTNFICCMPTNLYGPHDNFDIENAHVIPGLMAKMHKAKINNNPIVLVWGTGRPRREFLCVSDLANALFFLMQTYDVIDHNNEIINVGTGQDVTIAELAQLIKQVTGYQGKLEFNKNDLDGTPRKLLNVDKLFGFGWRPKVSLLEGLQQMYAWYNK